MALATHPKPAPHQKKRQAGHHRHSKHYLKAYWPYLPMLAIVATGLIINAVWSSNQHVLGTTSNFSISALLNDTNSYRLKDQEFALKLNAQLAAAAQAKANDMVTKNYWSHTSPTGETPWNFINAAGYTYQQAGENLAYGFNNAGQTITGWMSSPEHRANILTADYQNVGFGIASSPNYMGNGPETVVVAEYAEPVTSSGDTITFTVPSTPSNTITPSTNTELSAQPVSRIQLLTDGQALWSAVAVAAIGGAAAMLLIIRYGIRFKRAVQASEAFVVHHPFLDIATVFIATTGFVLTRAGGIIR